MRKILLILAVLSLHNTATAQSSQQPVMADLSYSFAEFRYVDVDGGDGFRLAGSYELDGPWIVVGSLTALDYNNNVDATLLEIGGGYELNYSPNYDLFGTLRLVRADIDTPGGGGDDTGFAISAGGRGFIAQQIEVRGSINHINLDNSDTYVQIAGDYHFTSQIAAGVSLDLAGDTDAVSIGARWYFR